MQTKIVFLLLCFLLISCGRGYRTQVNEQDNIESQLRQKYASIIPPECFKYESCAHRMDLVEKCKQTGVCEKLGDKLLARCSQNGDGTMTGADGTVWQICLYGQTWENGTCKGEPKKLTWYEAVEAAKKERFLGKSDWILPNYRAFSKSLLVDTKTVDYSINPVIHSMNSCFHPKFHLRNRGGYPKEVRQSEYSTLDLNVNEKYYLSTMEKHKGTDAVSIIDTDFQGATSSIYPDTNYNVNAYNADSDYYPEIYTVLVRNAPQDVVSDFKTALAYVDSCNASCRAKRKNARLQVEQSKISAREAESRVASERGAAIMERNRNTSYSIKETSKSFVTIVCLPSNRTEMISINSGGGYGGYGFIMGGSRYESLDKAAKSECHID